jgi:tetratricopeptide (TPR) repeat protein
VSPRPLIFISAVSRELKSARQLVANTLIFLGYQPVWQDIFGTETGDLRGLLRQQIDQCNGVVQLVGQCYGAEPPIPDEEFGRVSYTQYEALYARKRGKKVWYLFIDEHFPGDDCEVEPEEMRKLQATYRRRLQSDTHVFHPLASSEALEASVLKLRDDLTRLRRGAKQWAIGVAGLLVLIAVLVIWLVRGQGQAAREMGETKEQVATMTAEVTKLRQAIMEYPRVDAQVRESRSSEDPIATRERVYAELGKQLGVDPKALREKLPQLAEQLKRAPDASNYERANAAYVANDYLEAERLAMKAADETRRAASAQPDDSIKALILAGLSAQKNIQYARAMEHFRDAEKLTDRERNPFQWAQLQNGIADLLIDQGQYSSAENILQDVVEVRTRVIGSEHPDTLGSRIDLVNSIAYQGNDAEAEKGYREVSKLEEKVLGPEHPDTLASRNNLGASLSALGKYAEAEAELREVLKLRNKVLGPEHPETLMSRTNLAIALDGQGKYAEAEAQYRDVIKLQEKVVGSDHPQTLDSRNNLASTLIAEGKYADAEKEWRDVIKLQEKVVGSDHPKTLRSRANLATTLRAEGKYAEAEAEARAILAIMEKTMGPENKATLAARNGLAWTLDLAGKFSEAEQEIRPALSTLSRLYGTTEIYTLNSRDTLGEALRGQRKFAEAETEFRAALTGLESRTGVENIGVGNGGTLDVAYHLARCLKDENKLAEAKQLAERAVEGARKVLGPNHPSTQKYEKLLAELEAEK